MTEGFLLVCIDSSKFIFCVRRIDDFSSKFVEVNFISAFEESVVSLNSELLWCNSSPVFVLLLVSLFSLRVVDLFVTVLLIDK
jgi:hypothetical protein